ncbi:MAG: four helix bundle protein [Flavobacteriales bacterium]|nr:four helix bundle protein [Flavobacteriales bacterium]
MAKGGGTQGTIHARGHLHRFNIAEGNSRRSEKDKHRFMEFALGSAFELETQTLALQRGVGAEEQVKAC